MFSYTCFFSRNLTSKSTENSSTNYVQTWKTLGADTRLARAEDRVAEMMPAMVIGA